MAFIVYKITNMVNGKVYVGQTVRGIHTRWTEHKRHALTGGDTHRCPRLSRSIRRHGPDNFVIDILEICTNLDDLNKREEYWIGTLQSMDKSKGYNLQSGGMNMVPSESTRARMSVWQIGRKFSDESRKRMSDSHRSLPPRSADHCRKISEMNKGKKRSDDTRRKISASRIGKKCSADARAKMAAAARRRVARPGELDRLRSLWKGRLPRE